MCTEERQALQLALGSFFPAILLSGVVRTTQRRARQPHSTAGSAEPLRLWCSVLMWCGVVWCGVVLCCVMWWCGGVQIWPLQAIPSQLRWLSLALPTTWAATIGRDVMSRGWGLQQAEVWHGLLIICAWDVLLFLFAASRLRTQI